MSVNSFEKYFMSWSPEKERLTRPFYLSLANCLEEDIRSGKLAPGTRLPPQRELADYLGINFTTITRAYDLCKERSLIYGVTGRGSFVASLPGTPKNREQTIELGIVNGFDTVSRTVIEAAENVLRKGYLDQLFNYAEPAGHLHQRAAGVRWMERLGVKTDIAHTAVFSGAQNVISAALLSLFKLGDRIATDEFTYSNLIGTARLAHIPLVPIPGDSGGMRPDKLEEACRKKKINGIFLMPDCANPTTIFLSEERKNALAAVIRKYNLVLIEDDYGGMRRTPPELPLFARLPEQTVYICGSTRNVCSGLRVTFAAFPEQFREKLLSGLFHLNIKTSSIDAEIMTELIMSGKAEQILHEKQLLAKRANRIFDSIFPEYADPSKHGAFFRCLPLPCSAPDGIRLEEMLLRHGITAYHSYRFSAQKFTERPFLRLSVSSAGSDEQLRQGLEITGKVIRSL
ncbi:MAG: PLP-dependent aminotransferase family protein [Lentisphaeria bacterium]|nr:PLP-dependent aminotransferase family protein [Lentisphaeria bacterium]